MRRWHLDGNSGTDSDCLGAMPGWNKAAVIGTGASGTLTYEAPLFGDWVDRCAWISPASDPDVADWPSGDYTVSADFTVFDANLQARYRLKQITSACADRALLGTSLGFSGTGVHAYTVTSDPAAGLAGDRFAAVIQTRAGVGMMGETFTISVAPGSSSYLEGPLGDEASIDAEAQDATGAATADVERTGTIAADAQAASSSATTAVERSASIDAQAQDAAGAATAAVERTGTIAAAAQAASSSATAGVIRSASIAADAQPAAGALVAEVIRSAAIAAAAQDSQGSLAAEVERSASIDADAQAATAFLEARLRRQGAIAAAAQPASTAAEARVGRVCAIAAASQSATVVAVAGLLTLDPLEYLLELRVCRINALKGRKTVTQLVVPGGKTCTLKGETCTTTELAARVCRMVNLRSCL